jgi:hypothetical protein
VTGDPRPRVVLIGASNVTHALDVAVATATAVLGASADVYVAAGLGRSYGARSRVFVRELAGVRESRLWDVLRAGAGERRTYALVTDVGNDIFYRQTVDTIASWVDRCLDDLAALGARTSVVQLPLGSVLDVTWAQIQLLEKIYAGGRAIDVATAQDAARRLAARLEEATRRRGVALVPQERRWYGFDPIHIRRRCELEAWHRFMAPWRDEPASALATLARRPTVAARVRARLARPDERWLFGRRQRGAQPALRLADGTTISLY